MGAGPGGICFLFGRTGILACPPFNQLQSIFARGLGKEETNKNVCPTQAPWHFLYFFPDPQGQGSLRPTFAPTFTGFGASACAGPV
jgi:hypothetical protein